VGARGAALLLDDQILTTGEVPGTQQLREIGRWLDTKGLQAGRSGGVYATCSLGVDEPAFGDLLGIASGLLATRVSNMMGEYLVWFRPEQVQTVIWGGNPQKPFVVGNSPSDLSPRRSFAQWHQIVEGTSEPWTVAAQTTARLIGDTVTDVVIQFRAVGMLIAQNQLDLVRRQVERSEQAVLVAGVDGRILMQSEALVGLLPAATAPVENLADLARLFANASKAGRRIRELIGRRQAWRGEAEIVGAAGAVRPVLVRADPVFSAPERILGFVVVLIDLTDRKAADAARRRFQESVVERGPVAGPRVDGVLNFAYQNVLSSIIENAKLAALEITDGVEVVEMPRLLESVQRSVDRSATLLRHLIRYAVGIRRP
jgi:PAS domain-containing protein